MQQIRNRTKTIPVYIQGQSQSIPILQLKYDTLISQISQDRLVLIKDKILLSPKCASKQSLSLLKQYLNTKDLNIYFKKSKDIDIIISTLRITDYIGMVEFQQKFINKIVIPNINLDNCVALLEQTHKKLKNQQTSSQYWYSLLNSNISFLSNNLNQIYQKDKQRIKSLHERVLNQILERAIKNGYKNEEHIMELILKSKKINQIHKLCEISRKNIIAKKINPKIHAKLSWKLQNLYQITQKKTKQFKFLQFQWLLQAVRGKDNGLNVSLILKKYEKIAIGAFYCKLIWWQQNKQKKQQQTHIQYVLFNQQHKMKILNLKQTEIQNLGNSKIQLSIYCCMDHIYTFSLTYIANHHHLQNLQQSLLALEQLKIIALFLLQKHQYSKSIRFVRYYHSISNKLPFEIKQFPQKQLSSTDLDFIKKFKYNQFIQNRQIQTKRQQRTKSKTRINKIFASSPSRSSSKQMPNDNSIRIQDIQKITNLKNYFYDKSNPIIYKI